MLTRLAHFITQLFDPYSGAEGAPPRATWAFARWVLQPFKWVLAIYAALSLSIGVIEVAIIAAIGALVDLAAGGPEQMFSAHWPELLTLFLLIGVARPLLVTGQGVAMSLGLNPVVPQATVWGLHRHVLRHDVSYFQNDFAGRLAQKEMQGASSLYEIVTDSLNAVGMLLAFTLSMIGALAIEDWRLAVPAALWILGYAVLLRYCLPRIRKAARRRADVRAGVSGLIVDSFSNISTVKLFAHTDREESAARDNFERWRQATIKFGVEVTRLRMGLNIINAVFMAGILALGLWLWAGPQTATIGATVASAMLAYRATGMSGWIAFTALGVFANIGTLEDAVSTLTPPHDVTDRPEAKPPAPATGRIRFDDVRFHYGRESGAIDGVSLDIAPREKVGLVGPSGAGKTTLVSLLLRLHDVEGGRVLLDGADIRDLSQDGLRRQIGVITQETAMFNRSARDNVLYGRPDASEEEMREAARKVRALEFIEDLQDFRGRAGFDAHLGERGVKLSGGQRQRIALARVILKDAPILVLDEATSALDSEVEAAILESLETVMQGRTVIAIAHRLSTIAQMDRIVVLDQGRIVEQGAHEALLANGGLYATLWRRQSGGFLGRLTERSA